MTGRAVFLDRDGVINEKAPEGDYVKSWREFRFLPHTQEAIRRLKDHHFTVIVVTNQRGIALGRMTEEDLTDIHRRMQAELELAGANVNALYYCPHDLGACRCRKPDVGMFLAARRDFPGIDLNQSFLVSDSIKDLRAATRLGSRKVLIAQPTSSTWGQRSLGQSQPDFLAGSLSEAEGNFLLRWPTAIRGQLRLP